jgi:hypothetical protein
MGMERTGIKGLVGEYMSFKAGSISSESNPQIEFAPNIKEISAFSFSPVWGWGNSGTTEDGAGRQLSSRLACILRSVVV